MRFRLGRRSSPRFPKGNDEKFNEKLQDSRRLRDFFGSTTTTARGVYSIDLSRSLVTGLLTVLGKRRRVFETNSFSIRELFDLPTLQQNIRGVSTVFYLRHYARNGLGGPELVTLLGILGFRSVRTRISFFLPI